MPDGWPEVGGVAKDLLGGCVEPTTQAVMFSVPSENPSESAADGGRRRLRELVSIALSSPEFQRC